MKPAYPKLRALTCLIKTREKPVRKHLAGIYRAVDSVSRELTQSNPKVYNTKAFNVLGRIPSDTLKNTVRPANNMAKHRSNCFKQRKQELSSSCPSLYQFLTLVAAKQFTRNQAVIAPSAA